MKAFMIFTCLLIVIAVVHGDNEKLTKFYADYNGCTQQMGLPKNSDFNPEIVNCMINMNSEFFDEQGAIVKEKLVEAFVPLISDTKAMQEMQQLVRRCHDEAFQNSGSIMDKNMKFVTCELPAIKSVDKPT